MASTFWSSSERFPDYSAEDLAPIDRDIGIIQKNLSDLTREACGLEHRRALQIDELAACLMLPQNGTAREALSDLTERIFQSSAPETHLDVLRLSKILLRASGDRLPTAEYEEFFGNETIPVSAKAFERVAYLRSYFTDSAFLKLTATMQKPRAAYFDSFSDICEEVYHGLCEYCILPIESTKDGKLLRFYTLIEKYELKLAAVCDIEDGDGASTRYALLRHRYVQLRPSTHTDTAPLMAEFSLVLNDRLPLLSLLQAAELCHLHLLRADSLPSSDQPDGYRYGLVFSTDDTADTVHEIKSFLCYLSVMLPEYTLLGIYTQVF